MSRIEELAKELRKELENSELIKEYNKVKNAVESNEELNSLKAKIAKSVNDKELHEKLLNEFNSNPLVINLCELEVEVKELLKEVTEIINKK